MHIHTNIIGLDKNLCLMQTTILPRQPTAAKLEKMKQEQSRFIVPLHADGSFAIPVKTFGGFLKWVYPLVMHFRLGFSVK